MKKLYFFFVLLFSHFAFAQTNPAPPFEYIYANGGANSGVTFMNTRGVNSLFTIETFTGGISCFSTLRKFNNDKLLWSKQLLQALTTTCSNTQRALYPSQEDGVLVYFGSSLTQYDASGNPRWNKSISSTLRNATANLAGGFHLYTQSGNTNRIERIKNDGNSEWTIDILNFEIADIQTTSDDGVVISGNLGTRKYSSTGALQWTVNSGGSQILVADPSNMYLSNSQGVVKMNVANGNVIWTYQVASINDMKITFDKGIALITNAGLTKLKPSGELEWANTTLGGTKLAVTEDKNISVLRVNTATATSFITKTSINNQVLWQKELNGNLSDMQAASDNGLFATVSRFPMGFLYKISSTDTVCRYKSIVQVNQPIEFCKKGSAVLNGSMNGDYNGFNFIPSKDFSVQWQKDGIDIQNDAQSAIFTASTSGNYTFKIAQGRCAVSSESIKFRVFNEKAPTISTPLTNICNGYLTTLSSNGCDGTVVWSNGFRSPNISINPTANVAFSAYCEVQYKENNVEKTCASDVSNIINLSVSPPTQIRVSDIQGINKICGNNNATLTISASGGTAPITYTWLENSKIVTQPNTNSFIAKSGGIYAVEVTDFYNCKIVSNQFRVFKSDMKLTVDGNRDFCAGTSTNLTANANGGIGNYNYQWKRNDVDIDKTSNIIIKTGGNYTITVSDSINCSTSSNPITITEKGTGIIANITLIGSNTIFDRDSVTLNASSGAGFSYQWKRNGANIAGANKPTYYAKQSGTYLLEVSKDGCSVVSAAINITVNPLLSTEEASLNTKIYPNPASDELRIELPYGVAFRQAKIQTFDGKEINHFDKLFNNNSLNISNLQNGIYLLMIETSKGRIAKKVVKE
jgi:hypothetical protein